MIYFVRRLDGCIKIGTTTQPNDRLKTLHLLYQKLELLGVMEGNWREEEQLHERFKDTRIRLSPKGKATEWFNPTPELLDFIDQNAYPYIPTIEDLRVHLQVSTDLKATLSVLKSAMGVRDENTVLRRILTLHYGDTLKHVRQELGVDDKASP